MYYNIRRYFTEFFIGGTKIMKKILSIAIAAVMILCLSVSVFADYDEPVTLGLYAGGWGDVGSVVVDKPGTYSITASKIDSNDWIIVKNTAGETTPTSIPAGTVIRTTELKVNGTVVTFEGGNDYFDYTVGANGEIEIKYWLQPGFGGHDYIVDRPENITSVEVTFVVDPDAVSAEPEAPATDVEPEPEAPTAEPEAPAAEPAPAPEAPAATAPATGIVLAVVPAVMALAAVAVSKKH